MDKILALQEGMEGSASRTLFTLVGLFLLAWTWLLVPKSENRDVLNT